MKYNRKDIISAVAKKTGYTKSDVAVVVSEVFNTIGEMFTETDELSISNFGTFTVRTINERTGRNPRTGEQILIPPTKAVSFKSSANLKNKVRGNKING